MEPETVLGLSLLAMMALGFGTQMVRQADQPLVLVGVLAVVMVITMIGYWQFLSNNLEWMDVVDARG
eukprot:CAMPEP_0206179024 /NCGR_PEP_ID=MMETSP1474-20131121/66262_1 /ASSEMBLY_ACC=CAM_ASM_001110 /TAXON_ID=97495 /ORGANISM="Imantonia sp., Strain RCC918" /LENGTH=66 /DNA_ID=CAMNT_0053592019 /DNA_START=66 /DNA_END=266 /DNA_ORIENTATION=+